MAGPSGQGTSFGLGVIVGWRLLGLRLVAGRRVALRGSGMAPGCFYFVCQRGLVANGFLLGVGMALDWLYSALEWPWGLLLLGLGMALGSFPT